MFLPRKRTCILLPDHPREGSDKHLNIVLGDERNRKVVAVPVCTIRRKKYDDSCILQPGDHEFIKDLSYVGYKFCRPILVDVIINNVQRGRFTDKGEISEAVFERVIKGLQHSDHTRPFVWYYISIT